MVRTPDKSLTLNDFLRLPETEPASEFIDGQVIQKPMPQGKHSRLQARLVHYLTTAFQTTGSADAFPELRCTFGGRSIVPDVAVFVRERIPLDARGDVANVFELAPDWAIEILSPDQNQTRVTGNLLHCLAHGTRSGWLLDPDERSVLIFPNSEQPLLLTDETQPLPVPNVGTSLGLTLAQIFGWLQV
ncbi:MAG: Uma2 family endonuclease [Aphanocapsa lilacina HA4352-LM1]|jgi:Uma2 family endonuclease|nr:Uma2 family endonuclease [Aphanocapsa lilacina HA4352-LM1]